MEFLEQRIYPMHLDCEREKTGLVVGERSPDEGVADKQLAGQIHFARLCVAQRPEDAGGWIEAEPGLTLLPLELGDTAAAFLCRDPTKDVVPLFCSTSSIIQNEGSSSPLKSMASPSLTLC